MDGVNNYKQERQEHEGTPSLFPTLVVVIRLCNSLPSFIFLMLSLCVIV